MKNIKKRSIIMLMMMVLLVSVSASKTIPIIKDFKEIHHYKTELVCQNYRFHINGSQICDRYKEVDVFLRTEVVKDGKIRIGDIFITHNDRWCVNRGNGRIDCVKKDDGLHQKDPKSFKGCSPHGGMDCIIYQFIDDKNYKISKINSEKYDQSKGIFKRLSVT